MGSSQSKLQETQDEEHELSATSFALSMTSGQGDSSSFDISEASVDQSDQPKSSPSALHPCACRHTPLPLFAHCSCGRSKSFVFCTTQPLQWTTPTTNPSDDGAWRMFAAVRGATF